MPRDLPVVTLQDVVLGDIRGMKISTGPIRATIKYEVLDQDGEPHHSGTIETPMPAGLKQDIGIWITDEVLPDINSQEGMS